MKMTNVYYISLPPQNPNQMPLHHLNENSILQNYIYIYIYTHTHTCVCVTLLTSSSILFQPLNLPQSCPMKRNIRKSHLYYFICPVTSLLHTALRVQSSRMLHHVVGRWVRYQAHSLHLHFHTEDRGSRLLQTWYLYTEVLSVTSQKTIHLVFTNATTSNLT